MLPVQADVNAGADNQAAVQNVVKQAVDKFGRIDVLINNAQASASGVTLADHTTEQFDLAVYSGLYAVFYYMKACYPYLKETKGSVINFASGAGLFGNSLLRAVCTPYWLNLVTFERHLQLLAVLHYVTCERNGQVITKTLLTKFRC